MSLTPADFARIGRSCLVPNALFKANLVVTLLNEVADRDLRNDHLRRYLRRTAHALRRALAVEISRDPVLDAVLRDALTLVEAVTGVNGEKPGIDPVDRLRLAEAAVAQLTARCGEALGELKVVLADSESGAGGWGPDVTMLARIRAAADRLEGRSKPAPPVVDGA
jgi:hypothetical protein